MSEPIQQIPCDSEIRLIDAIKQNPDSRALFVELAEFLERSGLLEDSKVVYRGILPASIQTRHGLNPFPHKKTREMNSCTRLGAYGSEQYSLTAPGNEDAKRNSVFLEKNVTTEPEYVDLMHDGVLAFDGKNRLYVDKECTRNAEHSTMNSYLLMSRVMPDVQKPHLSGLSILLAARNSHNFYHWHFDCLAALGLVEAAGISLSQIDNILIDQRNRGFQVQMLLAAGIDEAQIRFIDVNNCTFSYDYMLMVRLHNQQGMAQSRRHLDWLRRTYLSTPCPSTSPPMTKPSRIAIRREVRGFSQPEAIYRILSDKGYHCVQLEELPYAEQASLFSNATHVVAPHGAGLSLLVYCRPGTVVHEFYADHVQPCFWSLSSALGLNYHNHNCSEIVDKATTSSNKNLAARLAKSVELAPEKLLSLAL